VSDVNRFWFGTKTKIPGTGDEVSFFVSGTDPGDLIGNIIGTFGQDSADHAIDSARRAIGAGGVTVGEAVGNLANAGLIPQPALAPGGGYQQQQVTPPAFVQQQPAPQQHAVAGPPVPNCNHGPMTYRSGTAKTGKPWAAYMCPTPKGDPGQCAAQWV
jgi:hypothetical protein